MLKSVVYNLKAAKITVIPFQKQQTKGESKIECIYLLCILRRRVTIAIGYLNLLSFLTAHVAMPIMPVQDQSKKRLQ